MAQFRFNVVICFALASLLNAWAARAADFTPFLRQSCFECHDGDTQKGNLNLESLKQDFADPANFAEWVKVVDRVTAGEMPPAKKPRPEASSLHTFTNSLSAVLLDFDARQVRAEGRATQRRLNRFEYEETLRDLLALPYLEVKAFLPEDRESHGFNKVGDALDVSHVQMARYLAAADYALRQAISPQGEPPHTLTNRFSTWEEREFFGKIKLEGPLNRRTFPLVGLTLQTNIMAEDRPKVPEARDPAEKEKRSMAVVVSTYEPTEIRFGGFRAPVAGRYRLKFSGYSIWMGPKFTEVTAAHRSEPVTIYAETPPRSLRKLGSFDFHPQPTECELDVWLLAGETIRPDAARLFRSRPPDHRNPLATPEGMPGVAFSWMQVEGPVIESWPPLGHQLLFGDLPTQDLPPLLTTNRAGKVRHTAAGVEIRSEHPQEDSERLLWHFLQKAYRRPVTPQELRPFLAVTRKALENGYSFSDSLLAGYTAILCSPGFLYLDEKPGRLGDWALAERLSYFLWNSSPDPELRECAARGRLHGRTVLHQQTERLLNDPRSSQFVNAFLDYWLDLRLIAGSAPDEELYPDYQLDDLLSESMIAETQMFFTELLRADLPVRNLINSDFAMINERLATHYGIAGVEGVGLRKVALDSKSMRGGLLTEASVLKVTANGTSTSPVKRGVWIMSRILGKPPQPPPPTVTAVDPDIRGATTIRDQLARHRSQESCNACHRDIDPAGFALESFDVMGAWRDRYRSVGQGDRVKGIGHNGNNFHFSLGLPVDCSGELPDGQKFADVRDLKICLLKDEEQVARNLVRQLVIYATGAPIRYSDRPAVEQILATTRSSGYGVRSLVHALVQSDLFLQK